MQRATLAPLSTPWGHRGGNPAGNPTDARFLNQMLLQHLQN